MLLSRSVHVLKKKKKSLFNTLSLHLGNLKNLTLLCFGLEIPKNLGWCAYICISYIMGRTIRTAQGNTKYLFIKRRQVTKLLNNGLLATTSHTDLPLQRERCSRLQGQEAAQAVSTSRLVLLYCPMTDYGLVQRSGSAPGWEKHWVRTERWMTWCDLGQANI